MLYTNFTSSSNSHDYTTNIVAGALHILWYLKKTFLLCIRSMMASRSINVHNLSSEGLLSSILLLCTILVSSFLLSCSAKDSIDVNSHISDDDQNTLVSAGQKFELGFFHLGGFSNPKRYLGIWYYGSNPPRYVWVANRDKPLLNSGGVFSVLGGNLKVLDAKGKEYWSALSESSSSVNVVVQLMDSGNLVLSGGQYAETLWQSFDSPTDTFLPGMKMSESIKLTSWKGPNDPGKGSYTFMFNRDTDQYVINKEDWTYWQSEDLRSGSDGSEMPVTYALMLSNFTTDSRGSPLNDPRKAQLPNYALVMNYTGNIQCWFAYSTLVWVEPRDQCSIHDTCGGFSSCYISVNNTKMCKCLPGFVPSSSENKSLNSHECIRKSNLYCKNDIFLRLVNMKAPKPDTPQYPITDERSCRMKCLENCESCQAYWFQQADRADRESAKCLIWGNELHRLREDAADGFILNVRVAGHDIQPTVRSCKPCGTNIIPYPLSTEPSCGDSIYRSFHCDNSTGQVMFKTLNGSYNVTMIDPDARNFHIQVKEEKVCDTRSSTDRIFPRKHSSPFDVISSWCTRVPDDFGLSFGEINEIKISWKPPREPPCSFSDDCKFLQHSSCNTAENGIKRCLCDKEFLWDDVNLNCTRAIEGRSRTISVYQIVVIALVCFIVTSCIYVLCMWRTKMSRRQNPLDDSRISGGQKICSEEFTEAEKKAIDVPFFSLDSILSATDDFSDANKLGQGGFGPVYKGKFPGAQVIAVKRLSSVSGQGLKEFINEVLLIAKLQHRNLVKLLGYCIEADEKILLYEYMPNKSLDTFIFDQTQSMNLDWGTRVNIILGIARGLLYLHQDSRLKIIHRDLKTSNILLDEDMNPKISDFGLARLFGGKQIEENTMRVVGTYGYMSPEYALDGVISVKSDIFSFGVVILEIISGRRNRGGSHKFQQDLSLLGYAWRLWTENNRLGLMDPTLEASCDKIEFLKWMNIGLLCVQEDPTDRPPIIDVVTMLYGESTNFPAPKQPAFVVRRDFSSHPCNAESSNKSMTNNELTVSLEAR